MSIVRKITILSIAFIASLSLGAYVSNLGANDYSRGIVGEVNRVDTGVVVGVSHVKLEGTKSGIGTAAGAAIGGLAASNIGGSKSDNLLAGAIGAVVGGLAGAAAEEGYAKKTGYSYTIRLDRNGELITVTQGADIVIPEGTPVYIEYGERARIKPIPENIRQKTPYHQKRQHY